MTPKFKRRPSGTNIYEMISHLLLYSVLSRSIIKHTAASSIVATYYYVITYTTTSYIALSRSRP